MEIRQKITPQVIAAATGLLQPYCPNLSPQGLIAALRQYNTGKDQQETTDRPFTRKEAAALLKCSLNTISRYLAIGKLRKIRLTDRSCRIDPESIKTLLSGSVNADTVEG